MGTTFHWFYCLPILDAVLLVVLATVMFLILRKMFGKTLYWKAVISLLFVFWFAVIFLATMGNRTESENLSESILTPFASYYAALNGGSKEIYRTNFMNMVLFYPAGLLGYETLPKRWKKVWRMVLVTVLFALVSIGIEYSQYHFGIGLAETDDVIHNTLGTLLGASACVVSIKLNHKR